MIFITELEQNFLSNKNYALLKTTSSEEGIVDAWLSEDGFIEEIIIHDIKITRSSNGIFGVIYQEIEVDNIEEIVLSVYKNIFEIISQYEGYRILRIWNYIPQILKNTTGIENIYNKFNTGRYQAFSEHYGQDFINQPIPAASAVGSKGNMLKIEFLAAKGEIQFIENKDQVPAKNYSGKYGSHPPIFSRGAIYKNLNQTILISSGTASVVGEESKHSDLYDQVNQSIYNLRILASQFNLKGYGIQYGFAIEDAVLLRTYYKREEDRSFLEKFLKKIVSPNCKLSFYHADICRDELLVEIEAVFVKKGEFEKEEKLKYFLDNNKIRTESFELHIAEHCNLRCRDCCNISPLNPQKFLSVEEIDNICQFLKLHVKPDLFKIAGGEPTLHPDIDTIIQTIKSNNVASQVRVVTNGLLLHRMSEEFWSNIDQLTISNYVSVPVKPKTLDMVKAKAKEYGIVLNIKYVDQFNEIFIHEPTIEPTVIQNIYDDCWMRHRCHIIRNGYFYKCTRAAYMNDYLIILKKEIHVKSGTYSSIDGISLKDANFKENLLAYLNEKKPLNSCHYCLGVSGGLRENIQLSKKEIEEQLKSNS